MPNINVLFSPPTAEQIRQLSAAVQGSTKFEDTAAFKVLMFIPIPILDVIASTTTYAIETAMQPDLSAPFQYIPGSADQQWPEGTIAANYVDKVRAQGRDLVRSEVEALNRAESLEAAVQIVTKAGTQALRDAFEGSAISSLLSAAEKAMASSVSQEKKG